MGRAEYPRQCDPARAGAHGFRQGSVGEPEDAEGGGSGNTFGADWRGGGFGRCRRVSGDPGGGLYHRTDAGGGWGFDRDEPVRMSAPRLIEPLPAHLLDAARLSEYLARHVDGLDGPLTIRQFQGGQSNPTYLLETSSRSAVLRKKPPGKLLPSAHQIDREYRIQKALQRTAVPVAEMLHYCADVQVIGTEFYVMEFL